MQKWRTLIRAVEVDPCGNWVKVVIPASGVEEAVKVPFSIFPPGFFLLMRSTMRFYARAYLDPEHPDFPGIEGPFER